MDRNGGGRGLPRLRIVSGLLDAASGRLYHFSILRRNGSDLGTNQTDGAFIKARIVLPAILKTLCTGLLSTG